MSDIITEALLEMHFHHALVEHFSALYGANFLRLLKPSQQQEAWVGFDQGWVNINLPQTQFLNELRSVINNQLTNINKFYIGFFLQFKRVAIVRRRSRLIPNHYNLPYFRSKLSLHPNSNSGRSQHETLLLLQNINNSSVFYACGMLFNVDAIYQQPDLNRLRLVPITSAPPGWNTNENHFIMFQTVDDHNPYWRSEPIKGISYSIEEWSSSEAHGPVKLSPNHLEKMISDVTLLLYDKQNSLTKKILPESMTIMEFEPISFVEPTDAQPPQNL